MSLLRLVTIAYHVVCCPPPQPEVFRGYQCVVHVKMISCFATPPPSTMMDIQNVVPSRCYTLYYSAISSFSTLTSPPFCCWHGKRSQMTPPPRFSCCRYVPALSVLTLPKPTTSSCWNWYVLRVYLDGLGFQGFWCFLVFLVFFGFFYYC